MIYLAVILLFLLMALTVVHFPLANLYTKPEIKAIAEGKCPDCHQPVTVIRENRSIKGVEGALFVKIDSGQCFSCGSKFNLVHDPRYLG